MKDVPMPRGRPRVEAIARFNVATDLTDGKKFIRFRRALGVSAKEAYLILVRFFNFVAVNYAFRPKISQEDTDILADYCWFEGEASELITALQTAGFVDPDLSVHDWFTHQPLAEKIVKGRDCALGKSLEGRRNVDLSSEKSGVSLISGKETGPKITREDNVNTNPPTPFSSARIECDSVPESRSLTTKTTGIGTKRGVHTIQELMTSLTSGNLMPNRKLSDADFLCQEFCDKYGYQDIQTRNALRHRIQTCGALSGLDGVRHMIGEIREDTKVRDPIKVLHFKLNQAIDAAKSSARTEANVAAA
jgi:hypothetical protein